jgi:gamma-glutamyltranspeptidase / glutathione hydrolase
MRRVILFSFLVIFLSGCVHKSDEYITGRYISAAHGIVVSAHPVSSAVGASVLKKGGNAIDAAVATEFALAVCYPEAGNIGGGGFMVVRLKDGSSDVIDYREKAPLKSLRDMYLDSAGQVIDGASTETRLAAGVPGTVDGMIRIHAKYGRLKFREVIQPAIDLASRGFHIKKGQAESLNGNRDYFIKQNSLPPAFVKNGNWKEGDLLVQKDLAATLERIRDKGREGFYSGTTAELISAEMKRGNGIMTPQDLQEYSAIFRKPLTGNYRGYRIISVPPPSSGGIILLQLFGMTGSFAIGDLGYHSVKSIHIIAEAEKRAFADRAQYAGDPDFVNVHTEALTDPEYITGRFRDFDMEKPTTAGKVVAGAVAQYESHETTHYSVADGEGNAVAATTTLNNTFGSSIVVQGAGFLLNDQMDDFSVKPGSPNMYGLIGGEANAVSPGKRMLSSMSPVIVEKEGKLFLVAGSPGGSTIPTTVFQVITNIIDYGMSLRQAVDTSRFHNQWLPDNIQYEKGGIDPAVVGGLVRMGYQMKERSMVGSVNAISVRSDGIFEGCGDRRGDNTSCGY